VKLDELRAHLREDLPVPVTAQTVIASKGICPACHVSMGVADRDVLRDTVFLLCPKCRAEVEIDCRAIEFDRELVSGVHLLCANCDTEFPMSSARLGATLCEACCA